MLKLEEGFPYESLGPVSISKIKNIDMRTGFLLRIFFWGEIYCYANFYCYSIVFEPNFREGQKFSRGQTASGGGRPPAPLWEKARGSGGDQMSFSEK